MRRQFAIATILGAVASVGSLPAHAADVAGSTDATFVNPQPAGATTTGVGTNTFTYGLPSGPATELTFTGNAAFSSSFNTKFYAGTLFFHNGVIALGTEATSVDLALASHFTTPGALGTVVSTFTLALVTTPNTDDPIASADFVNLPGSFTPSIFNIAGTNYTVAPVDFENVVGDGFLGSSGTQLHVIEGGDAHADLYVVVTSDTSGVTPGVPEPSTWAMMLIGFAGLGFASYRNRKSLSVFSA
jgi:PEP-CTERM motif